MTKTRLFAVGAILSSLFLSSCVAPSNPTPEINSDSTSVDTAEPTDESVELPPEEFVSEKMVDFDLGPDSGCGVMESGSLWCWGRLFKDDEGNSIFTDSQGRAVLRQVQGIDSAVAVVVTPRQVCALHEDESISCFSEAPSFVATSQVVEQTGLDGLYSFKRSLGGPFGARDFSSVPGLETAAVVSGEQGEYHGCAVLDDGTVRCWGEGLWGQLGVGRSVTESRVALQVSEISNAISVRVGSAFSCALDGDGMISCWGQYDAPVPVLAGMPYRVAALDSLRVQQVDIGGDLACVVDGNSEVWCWGQVVYSTLFDPSRSSYEYAQKSIDSPWKVPGVSNVISVVVGDKTACALSSNGTVSCWGEGILGDGRPEGGLGGARGPVRVAGISSGVSLSTDGYGWCAALEDGTARCWGRGGAPWVALAAPETDEDYQRELLSPVAVDVGLPLSQISPTGTALTQAGVVVNVEHGKGLESFPGEAPRGNRLWELEDGLCVEQVSDSEVFCVNSAGLRGDGGTSEAFFAPFERVSELKGVVDIASTPFGTNCAILSDSSTWCWGDEPIATSQPLENLIVSNARDSEKDFYAANRVDIPPAVDVSVHWTVFGMPGGGCAASTDSELWCWGLPTATYQWFSPIKFQTSWGVDPGGE